MQYGNFRLHYLEKYANVYTYKAYQVRVKEHRVKAVDKNFHKSWQWCQIPAGWQKSLLKPKNSLSDYLVALMFFAWERLCAPCSQSSEETRLSSSDVLSDESLASWHRAPPEDICRYSAQHKTVQRDECRFRERSWEASLINNKSITWCTDRGHWLHNGSTRSICTW